MKVKILIMISTLSFLLVGCNDINNNKSTNVEPLQEQQELNKTDLHDKDIENHTPYIDNYSGEIDVAIINERYNNVNKEELTYDAIDIESIIEEHNDNPDNITKIYFVEDPNGDASYRSILEGYSYKSEGNVFNFTYDEAIELAKKVLPDDIEKVDSVLNKEHNAEYIYYKSSKGNFRVNLFYINDISDKSIDEIHKGHIDGITYSKEFK